MATEAKAIGQWIASVTVGQTPRNPDVQLTRHTASNTCGCYCRLWQLCDYNRAEIQANYGKTDLVMLHHSNGIARDKPIFFFGAGHMFSALRGQSTRAGYGSLGRRLRGLSVRKR